MERLSNLVEYTVDNRGKNPPYYTDNGIPVIDTFLINENIYPNIDKATRFIDKNLLENFVRCKCAKNDLLITLVGNGYGNSCLCGDNQTIIQNAVGLRFKKGIDKLFMYYYFKQKSVIKWIQNLDRGSAQPNVKVSDLKRMKIDIPDLPIQEKCSLILNNYDQLIENNKKRINLLEKMAEALYKEWFVRCRFPKFDSVKTKLQVSKGWIFGNRENGQFIPNNWKFGELKNIGIFRRGRNITSSEMKEGDIPVIAAGLEPAGYHNNCNVNGFSLTISSSGANAGCLLYHLDDIWAADCSYYKNDSNIWFVYNALKFLQPVISNLQIGSAQPHVYAKNINRLNVIIPTNDIIEKYSDIVKNYYCEIKVLKEKNDLLVCQRNTLLPKIINGKFSLEKIGVV